MKTWFESLSPAKQAWAIIGGGLLVSVLLLCGCGALAALPEPDGTDVSSSSTTSAEPSSAESTSPSPSASPETSSPEPEPTSEEPPPKPSKSKSPEREVDLCGAPQNPYGYNFCGNGGLVYDPDSGVCVYFDCIDYFDEGKGHMVQCGDGKYSMSGGRRGVCSYHDGHQQDVYGG